MTTSPETGHGDGAQDMTVSWDISIPMSDGAVLRANVYRPSGAEHVPVIVNMGPYGKDLPMSATYPQLWAQMTREQPEILTGSSGRYLVWEVPDPERWVPHGYALAHVDARGTGRSPGLWSPFSERESADFAESIEWLAGQPWCNGKAGVLGVSYHAVAAWRVAEHQPPHLAAVIPWYGAGDAYREAWRHGGILSNTFIDAWWYRWVRNQHGSGQGQVSPFTGQITTGPEIFDAAKLERMRVNIPAAARAHPLFDEWSAAQAVDWSRVTVPFLSVGSWGTVGLHLRGNVEAFRHAASTGKWLMLVAAQGAGVDRFYNDQGVAIQRRFFDHYLKGVDNDWPAQPPVTYELREPPGRRTVRSTTAWPPDQTHWMPLHLDVAQRTMNADLPGQPGQVRYWPTSDGVTFHAPPFEGRTEIAGPLALRLQVSTDAADLDIFASLQVLDADGAIAGPPAARGWLRLSHRELDEQASATGSPVLAHRQMSQVVAGERYAVDVEMWPAAFVVPGHGSLLLTIQGIDTADAQLARHNDPDDRASTSFADWTTLYSDEHAPSTLILPVSG